MAALRREPRAPAKTHRQISLTREQRDRIDAAATALEAHAGHDEDPLAMLLAVAELRGVVGEWDGARDARSAEAAEQGMREALRQIADAKSGIWGSIARDALDDCDATGVGDRCALGDDAGGGTPAPPGDAIAARGHGAHARR